MIHVVTRNNYTDYAHYLKIMHQQRHEIYAEGHGWVPTCPTGLEIDEYDSPLVTYLLLISKVGTLEGSVRLVPTDCANMLADHFAEYLAPEIPVPCDPDIWEIDRFYIYPKHGRERNGLSPARQLFLSMIDYALSNGVTALTGVFPTGLLRVLLAWPWEPTYLGLPKEVEDGDRYVPLKLDIDDALYDRFLDFAGAESSCLAPENHGLPMPESSFNALEMRLLSRYLQGQPELRGALTGMIENLTSPKPEVRGAAERLLDTMIAREERKQGISLQPSGHVDLLTRHQIN